MSVPPSVSREKSSDASRMTDSGVSARQISSERAPRPGSPARAPNAGATSPESAPEWSYARNAYAPVSESSVPDEMSWTNCPRGSPSKQPRASLSSTIGTDADVSTQDSGIANDPP